MDLKEKACQARRLILAMIYHAGSGHPGGSLSAIDLMLWVMDHMKPEDRFVLSKGHAAPALYAALALNKKIPLSECATFRKIHSRLQGHPSVQDLPQVEASTGSLGQGFSTAVGMALGAKSQNQETQIYSMIGDGECQEGQVWEAAMFSAHYELDNLVGILDYNKLQSDDRNANILGLEPLAQKWKAFGWNVIEIDGHDFGSMEKIVGTTGKPTMVIAHTIKGKGVPYMEDKAPWHGSVKLSEQDLLVALRALETQNPEAWLHISHFDSLEANQ